MVDWVAVLKLQAAVAARRAEWRASQAEADNLPASQPQRVLNPNAHCRPLKLSAGAPGVSVCLCVCVYAFSYA